MATDRFQGDPYLTLTEDGAEINFIGGQPTMDQGLDNQARISIFTDKGWWGNSLETDPNKQPGSDVQKIANDPTTREQLQRLRKEAIRSVENPAFKSVDGFIEDLGGDRVAVRMVMTPPSGNEKDLLLTKNGQNWISQRDDPAYLK